MWVWVVEGKMLTALLVYQHMAGATMLQQVHRAGCLLAHLVLRASKVQVELLAVDGLAQGANRLAEPLLRAPADTGQVTTLC